MKTKFILALITLVCFINTQSQTLQWANAMLGSGGQGTQITVDATGNVYTIGSYSGTTDFDPGAGVFTLTPNGSTDVFISKLDASGNFVWVKSFGAAGTDAGKDIALDASGDVYALLRANNNNYLYKLAAAGSTVWIKNIGAAGEALTLDATGNIYLTGGFTGTPDFDPGAGTFTITAVSGDVFVSKLDPSGNFVWAKSMGGPSADASYDIALDATGNIYTTGGFNGTADFDPGAGSYTISSSGSGDIFISKLDVSGNFVWAVGMGAITNEAGYAIAVNASGVHTTGNFFGAVDFDPGAGTYTLGGTATAFVLKLDLSGNFVWAKNIGTAGRSIALDGSGNVYSTGGFLGNVDFDPGVGTYTLASAGSYEAYISKLDASGNFILAGALGGPDYDIGFGIAVDGTNNAHITGYFNGTADFDPGIGVTNIVAPGVTAGYIYNVKLGTGIVPPSGIKEINILSNNNVLVFPNPSKGLLNVQLKNSLYASIKIMNALGQEVYNETFLNNERVINLEAVQNGIYFLSVSENGKIIANDKIVIEK